MRQRKFFKVITVLLLFTFVFSIPAFAAPDGMSAKASEDLKITGEPQAALSGRPGTALFFDITVNRDAVIEACDIEFHDTESYYHRDGFHVMMPEKLTANKKGYIRLSTDKDLTMKDVNCRFTFKVDGKTYHTRDVDITYDPSIAPSSTAPYLVVHSLYNPGTKEKVMIDDYNVYTAPVDGEVEPDTIRVPGYHFQSYDNQPIREDGRSVIFVNYTANRHTLTWDLDGAKPHNPKYTRGDVYFGTPIREPFLVKKDGYEFKGYDQPVPETMPDKDLTLKAVLEPIGSVEPVPPVGPILPDTTLPGGTFRVTSPDKSIVPTAIAMSASKVSLAKQALASDERLLGTDSCVVTVSAVKNGEAVNNYGKPLVLQMAVPKNVAASVKDFRNLTLAQVGDPSALELNGGTYNAATGMFTAKLDKAGDFVLIEKDSLTKLALTIGNKNTMKNDQSVAIDVAPMIVSNRTMVPLRYIGESLGCKVTWKAQDRSITVEDNGKKFKMVVDKEIPGFGAAPIIRDSRTLVPIRYVSEALGANVIYDPTVREVLITK